MLKSKLQFYFFEAKRHIEKIDRAKEVIASSMPLQSLNVEEKIEDKLDILAFRFAKLQDLIGEKIFRNLLEYSGLSMQGKRFVEILSELEREGLVDVDQWIKLRRYRNMLAHEYPYEEDSRIEAINYIYANVDYLKEITKNLEIYFYEIEKRGN